MRLHGLHKRLGRTDTGYLAPHQAMNVLSDAVHSALSLPGNVHVSSQLPSGAFG